MPTSGDKPVIFIAGHRGMVGSAIARQLQAQEPNVWWADGPPA